MESKVSRRLKEPLAREICEHIYGPRLARDFAKQFDYLTDVNQAHLLMLSKTGLVSPETAKKLASGLLQMEAEGASAVELDPAKEDPYFNYEAKLMSITGRDVGGRLHMARSRNDIAATIDRMRARSIVLDVIEGIGRIRRLALQRAGEHANVVMPGYTHLQPAQPITFGFYLSAVADTLGRDMERLQSVLARIDALPLGAGALAGTRFPIDRSVTAAAAWLRLLSSPTRWMRSLRETSHGKPCPRWPSSPSAGGALRKTSTSGPRLSSDLYRFQIE